MFFLRGKRSYRRALNLYLKELGIAKNSPEAEKIIIKMEDLLDANEEARDETEHIIAVIATLIVKIEQGEDREELLTQATEWLCSLSALIAMMYLFKDIRSLHFDGARECLEERFDKYFSFYRAT